LTHATDGPGPVEIYRDVELKTYESRARNGDKVSTRTRYFCFVPSAGRILSDDTLEGLKAQIDKTLE